jgi:hypothetical protein
MCGIEWNYIHIGSWPVAGFVVVSVQVLLQESES